MFSSLKRFIASILIIAMVATSSGITTFAASISRVATTSFEEGEERKKSLSYKYYEEIKYKSGSYLLKDDEEPTDTKLYTEPATKSLTSSISDADENKRDNTKYDDEKENDENITTDENGNEVGNDYESKIEGEDDEKETSTDSETSFDNEKENDENKNDEESGDVSTASASSMSEEENTSTASDVETETVDEVSTVSEVSTYSDIETETISTESEFFIATKAEMAVATQSLFGKTGGNLRRYVQYFDAETGGLVATTYIGEEYYSDLTDVDHYHSTIQSRLDSYVPYGYERSDKEAKFGWGVIEPGKWGSIVKKVTAVSTKEKSIKGANSYGDITDCQTIKDDDNAYSGKKSKDIDVDWHAYNIGFMWVGNGGARNVYNWQGRYNWRYAVVTEGGDTDWLYTGDQTSAQNLGTNLGSWHDNSGRAWSFNSSGIYLIAHTTNLETMYATTGSWAVIKGESANAGNCYEIYQCRVKRKTYYVTYHIVDENRNEASVDLADDKYIGSTYSRKAYSRYTTSYRYKDKASNCSESIPWDEVWTRKSGVLGPLERRLVGSNRTFPNTTGKSATKWYTSAWGSTKYDFNSEITGNIDLYCVYDWKDVEIKYDYNGGGLNSGKTAKGSRKYNVGLSQSDFPGAGDVTRKGYTLDYWSYNNSKVTNLAGNNDTVYKVVAVWKKNKVTLKSDWANNTTKNTVTKIEFKSSNTGYTTASKEFLLPGDGNMCAYRDGNVITICADSSNKKVFADTSLKELFKGFTNLEKVVFDGNFDTSGVQNFEAMFDGCTKLSSVDLTKLNTSSATNMKYMFRACPAITELNLTNFNFSKVTSIDEMFRDDTELTKISVAKGYTITASAKKSTNVFTNCNKLRGNGVYGYDANMISGIYARVGAGPIAPGYFTGEIPKEKYYVDSSWFNSTANAKSDIKKVNIKTGPISSYDDYFLMDADQGTWGYVDSAKDFIVSFDPSLDTLYVGADASELFAGFSSASEITGLNLINTSEATNMSGFFKGDANITSVDLASLNTSKVTNMSSMFEGASRLTTVNVDTFDTSNVTNMSKFLKDCDSITALNLSHWVFDKVTDASSMFEGADRLRTITVDTNVRAFGQGTRTVKPAGYFGSSPAGVNTTDMFKDCVSLVGGSGYEYNAGHTDGEFARVDYGNFMPGYFTIDDYSKVGKVFLSKDFARSIIDKGYYHNIVFRRGYVPETDYDAEVVLYDDTVEGGSTYALRDGRQLIIAYGKEDGSTVDRLYATEDFSYAFASFSNVTSINTKQTISGSTVDLLDTSRMKVMKGLFQADSSLTSIDLSGFVLENVEDASSLFEGDTSLTNITWDFTDNAHMFGHELKTMSAMFKGMTAMTSLDISRFKVADVDNISSLFEDMENVTNIVLPSGFGGKATNMSKLFKNCKSISVLPVENLSTNRAKDLREMFYNCDSVVELSLLNFNTEEAQYMERMFYSCDNLTTISADDFDTTNLLDNGTDMFLDSTLLDGGAGTTYNVASVSVLYAKIDNAPVTPGYFKSLNLYKLLPGWEEGAGADLVRNEIKKITILQGIHTPVPAPTSFTKEWDIRYTVSAGKVLNSNGLKGYLVDNGSDKEVIIYAASESDVKGIYLSNDASYLFGADKSRADGGDPYDELTTIENLDRIRTNKASNMKGMFAYAKNLTTFDLSEFNTSSVEDMEGMFEHMEAATTFDFTSFDTEKVSDMSRMFYACESITTLNLSSFDLSAARDMSYMFAKATSLASLTLPARNIAKNARDLSYMFSETNLVSIPIDRFDVASAENMREMFSHMTNLTSMDLSNLDTKNVIDMTSLFDGDSSLTTVLLPKAEKLTRVENISYMLNGVSAVTTLALPKFENATNASGLMKGMTSLTNLSMADGSLNRAENLSYAFASCGAITELDLTSWDTSHVTDMSYMFASMSSLTTIKASDTFDTSHVTSSANMFLACRNLVGHEGTVYADTNANNVTYAIVDNASAGHPGYFTGSRYTFGPSWNYVVGRNKSEIETITFVKGLARTTDVDDTFAIVGGLRGVRHGRDLTIYITKDTIDVMLDAVERNLFAGCTSLRTITNLNYLKSDNVTDMSYMFANLASLSSLDISTFDTNRVTDMQSMFRGDLSLASLVLPANFGSASTNMSHMFDGAAALNMGATEIQKISTANVENFSYMFAGMTSQTTLAFNTQFDTSKATNMKAMFKGDSAIAGNNLNVSSFDTKNVTDMSEMFDGVSRVTNLPISGFDTSNVRDMHAMFRGVENATSLYMGSAFKTRKVTDMSEMFSGMKRLTALNLRDDSKFETATVSNMKAMFKDTSALANIYIDSSTFNTAKVTNMSHMFDGSAVSSVANFIGAMDTSRVTDMSYMFASMSNVAAFDLNELETGRVTDMSYMFANDSHATSFNFPKSFVDNATNLEGMFYRVSLLTDLNLSSFDTSRVTNMSHMFENASSLKTITVSNKWIVASVVNDANMFLGAVAVVGFAGTTYDGTHIDKDYAIVDGTKVGTVIRKGYLTAGAYTIGPDWEYAHDKADIRKVVVSKFPTPAPTSATEDWLISGGLHGYKVGDVVYLYANKNADINFETSVSGIFRGMTSLTEIEHLEIINTTDVVDMSHMFDGDENLVSINLSNFDTSKVINMQGMFKDLKSLKNIDLSRFDTRSVSDMSYMFSGLASVSNIDVTHFETATVSNMSHMFEGMKKITGLDISNFDTSKVTDMSYMFAGDENLSALDVTRFDTSRVTKMAHMFENLKKISSIDLLNFDVENVDDFSYMFRGLSSVSELDISGFMTRSATDVSYMFADMIDLTTIYASAKYSLRAGVIDDAMFRDDTKLRGGAGTTWNIAHIDSFYARVDKGTVRPGYFTGQVYTAHLVANGGVFADGSVEKYVQIVGDENTNKFEIPTKVGNEFDNYYVGSDVLENTWVYTKDKTTTVTAHWKAKTYNIYYEGNGGKGTMLPHTIEYGADVVSAIKTNTFTRDGYNFTEWSFDGHKMAEITTLAGTTPVNDFIWSYIISKNIKDIKLTANWKGKEYKIVYHGNGGKTSDDKDEYSEEKLVFGKDYKLTANKFSYKDRTFNGWAVSATTARRFGDLATYSSLDYRATVDLYAKWLDNDAIYGKLTLDGNGGLVNGVAVDEIYLSRYNQVPAADLYREGYNFINWSSGSEIVPYPTICDFKDLTLTANWAPVEYTIRYHENNGTDNYVEKIATYNEAFKIASYSGTDRFGYHTIGWSYDADSMGIDLAEGTEVINLTSVDKKIINLYAIWVGNVYNVNLHNYDPVSGDDKEMTFTYGKGERIVNIATESYTDADGNSWTFGGWATMSGTNKVSYYNNQIADYIYEDKSISDIDLYSVWIDTSKLIYFTFDANEGLINGEKSLTVSLELGQDIPYPAANAVTRKGYDFVKWMDAKVGGAEFNEPKVNFNVDTTVFADWSEGTYIIEYIGVNHTSGSMTHQYADYTATVSILNSGYRKLGYKFMGWDTSPDATTVVYRAGEEVKSLADAGDILKLYTVWEANDYTITYYDVNGTIIGTNTLNYEGMTRLLTNRGFRKGYVDAGFEYNDGTTTKPFASGQRVSKDDFNITESTDPMTGIELHGKERKAIYQIKYITPEGEFPDGTTIKIASISYGDIINHPADPTNKVDPAKNFLGWGIRETDDVGNPYATTTNNRKYESPTYDLEGNTTFEAIWKYDKYIAILDAAGGSFANAQGVKAEELGLSETTAKLEIPQREGYKFDEYYVDGKPIVSTWSYIHNQTVILKAHWIPNNYYVVYSTLQGRGVMDVDIATYGEPYIVKDCEFDNPGNNFVSWVVSEYGKKDNLNIPIFVSPGDPITKGTSVEGGFIELTAAWISDNYTVHYDGNGAEGITSAYKNYEHRNDGYVPGSANNLFGKGTEQVEGRIIAGGKMNDSQYTYGMTGFKLQQNAYVRPGYEFIGWALSPDSTIVFNDVAAISTNEEFKKEYTLYAIWQPEEEYYGTLELVGNGGLVNGATSFVVSLSTEEPIVVPTVERPGYRFTYWSTDDVQGAEPVAYPKKCNFNELTLYAHWEPINYIVRIYENKDDNNNNYIDLRATYNETIHLPDYTGTYGDVAFKGYVKTKYSNLITYRPGRLDLSNLTQVDGEIVTLYAQWDILKYRIRLHDLDILNKRTTIEEFTYRQSSRIKGVTRRIATISGVSKVFSGWATVSTTDADGNYIGEVAYYDGHRADTIFENEGKDTIDLYPVWKDKNNGAVIVFDAAGGSISGDKRTTNKYAYGDKVTFPGTESIKRTGYKLTGWTDINGNTYDVDNTYIDFVGDRILTANWTPGNYKIEYHRTGADTVATNSSLVDATGDFFERTYSGGIKTKISDNIAFARPGYEFKGWDISEVGETVIYKAGEEVDALADVDETIKLYAVWQARTYTINYYDGDGVLIGSNSIILGINTRILPNTSQGEGEKDAGYTYEVGGTTYHFSSGQSIDVTDLNIVEKKGNAINSSGTPTFSGGRRGGLFGASPTPTSDPTNGVINLFGDKAKNVYTIRFDANGGEYPDGDTVKLATASTGDSMLGKYPRANPTKGIREFLGWSINGVLFTSPTYPYNSTVTFDAVWEKDYKARLKGNGGVFATGLDTELVEIHRKDPTDKFEIPVRKGYTFDKYYAEGEVLKATWSYIVKEITDVDATWIPNNYKVTYESGGGLGFMAPEIATYDTLYKVAKNSYTKSGYKFDGWKFNDTTTYIEGTEVSNLTSVKDGVVKLVATWKPLTYNITYHGNTGKTTAGLTEYKESGLTYGVDHTLKGNDFRKTGYTFRGWALSTNSSVAYFNLGTYTKDKPYVSNLDLYAIWLLDTEKHGTLTLHGNGGLINGVSDITMDLRINEEISLPTLEYVGHKFVEWRDNSGVVTSFPEKCDTWTSMELTAYWSTNTYNVSYYRDEKDTAYIKRDANIAYDADYRIEELGIAAKPYYTNVKWTTYENGLKKELVAGATYSELSEVDGVDINLYATYEGDKYEITLHETDLNHPGLSQNTKFTYGEGSYITSIVNKIATVSGVGYVFAGWATSSTATDEIVYYDGMSADLIYEAEGKTKIDLYSIWLEKSKVVYLTFDANGGYVNGREKWTIPVATDGSITYPDRNNVVRRGYVFRNWMDQKTGGSIYNSPVVDFDKDKTLYADWDDTLSYTINYLPAGIDVTYGGSPVSASNKMASESKRTIRNVNLTANAYEKLGYEFIGWDINPEGKTVVYGNLAEIKALTYDVGEVVNLYTVWKAKEYTVEYYAKDTAGNYTVLIGTNSLVYGNAVTLLPNTAVPKGSEDLGYTDIITGTTPKFSSGQSVTGEELGITNSTTVIKLYALTSKITYVVRFFAKDPSAVDANDYVYFAGTPQATTSVVRYIHYGDTVPYKLQSSDPDYLAAPTNTNVIASSSVFNGYTVDNNFYWSDTYDFTVGVDFVGLWDKVPFIITFHQNEPASPDLTKKNPVSGKMDVLPAFASTSFLLKHNNFNVVGYEFVGWATSSYTQYEAEYMRSVKSPLIIPDGPEDPKDPTAVPLMYDRKANENMDFYALWARKKTRVTILQNELEGEYTIKDPYATVSEVYYDSYFGEYMVYNNRISANETITHPAFDPIGKARTHYNWSGVFTTYRIEKPVDRSRTYYTPNLDTMYRVTDINRVVGNLTLYPLWRNESDRVRLIYDTSTAKLPDDSLSDYFEGFIDAPYFTPGEGNDPKEDDGKIVDLIALPEKVRIFDHWSINSDGSDVITKDTIYDGTTNEIYGNVRFRDEYVVHYDPNGGQGYMKDSKLTEGIEGKLSKNLYTKSGFEFNGWLDKFDSHPYGDEAKIDNPTKALTLEAQWKRNGNGATPINNKGGNRGSGGSGIGVGSIKREEISTLVTSMIPEKDTLWVTNDLGVRVGLRIRKDSVMAKAIMNSTDLASLYLVLADNDYIQIKGGFFSVEYKGQERYYGFNENGTLLTGFVNTIPNMPIFGLNAEGTKLVKLGAKETGKYYLMENAGDTYAMVWALPITIKYVYYEFDSQGKVIKETKLEGATKDAWEYDPIKNKWRYYTFDASGNPQYAKSVALAIETLGSEYYYIFDDEGYMKTGLTEYNGVTYYLEETGSLTGAIYVGDKVINDILYTFDKTGALVNEEKYTKTPDVSKKMLKSDTVSFTAKVSKLK